MPALGKLGRQLLGAGRQPLLRARPVRPALGGTARAPLALGLAGAALQVGTQPACFALHTPVARLDTKAVLLVGGLAPAAVVALGARLALRGLAVLRGVVDVPGR